MVFRRAAVDGTQWTLPLLFLAASGNLAWVKAMSQGLIGVAPETCIDFAAFSP